MTHQIYHHCFVDKSGDYSVPGHLHQYVDVWWSVSSQSISAVVLLTHCGLVMLYGHIWVNIGSSNGLVPNGTKPLPEPKLTYHWWGSLALTEDKFHRKISICK